MAPPAVLGNGAVSGIGNNNANQEVSSSSVFWGIMAVALGSTAQTSFIAPCLFEGVGGSEQLLTPLLTSPIFCAADALVELYILVMTILRRAGAFKQLSSAELDTGDAETQDSISAESLAPRVVLFVLAVLPQSIKIFGMKNVPYIQTLAAMLLSASVVRFVSMAAHAWTGDERRLARKRLRRLSQSGHMWLPRMWMPISAIHLPLYSLAWQDISWAISKTLHARWQDFQDPCDWVLTSTAFGALVATLLWCSVILTQNETLLRLYSPRVSPLYVWLAVMTMPLLVKRGIEHGSDQDAWVSATVADWLQFYTTPLATAMFVSALGALIFVGGMRRLAGTHSTKDEASADEHSQAPNVSRNTGTLSQQHNSSSGISLNGTSQAAGQEENASTDSHPTHEDASLYVYWIYSSMKFRHFRRQVPVTLKNAYGVGYGEPQPTRSFVVRFEDLLRAAGWVIISCAAHTSMFVILALANILNVWPALEALWRMFGRLDEQTIGVSFAIFNLLTLAMYCFVAFDGTGTVSPQWTNFLGK